MVVAGSVVAVGNPVPGLVLVTAGAASAFLDAAGILHLARRLTGRRASQNVESREQAGKAGVLVLVAPYDQGRRAPMLAAVARLLKDPWLVLLAAMLVILGCCAARAAGAEGTPLTVVQFAPTLLLILAAVVLVDAELSDAAPSPARDAAAVTAIRLASDLGGKLEHFNVWLVLTGSERPFALGMGGWLRRRRKEIDPECAAVVVLGSAGTGPVRYSRREGPLLPLKVHSRLQRICAEVAEDHGGEPAAAVVRRAPSDAAAAIARGLPAVTVAGGSGSPDAAAADRLHGFCRELILRLDAEVGPSLPAARAASEGAGRQA